ncbi:hypothetical protein [Streptomyces canus]|uniref:hypothetical protein n=1 Tax=Streptomyces canus TaxID=58343 RepID=UPI0003A32E93|nr:hypothetical protein [Streptomyces canus]
MAPDPLTKAHLHTPGPYALRLLAAGRDRLRTAVWGTDTTVPRGFSERRASVFVPLEDTAARCTS